MLGHRDLLGSRYEEPQRGSTGPSPPDGDLEHILLRPVGHRSQPASVPADGPCVCPHPGEDLDRGDVPSRDREKPAEEVLPAIALELHARDYQLGAGAPASQFWTKQRPRLDVPRRAPRGCG